MRHSTKVTNFTPPLYTSHWEISTTTNHFHVGKHNMTQYSQVYNRALGGRGRWAWLDGTNVTSYYCTYICSTNSFEMRRWTSPKVEWEALREKQYNDGSVTWLPLRMTVWFCWNNVRRRQTLHYNHTWSINRQLHVPYTVILISWV